MMIRTGQCNQCGNCCKVAGYITEPTAELIEWTNARGIGLYEAADGYVQVAFPSVCSHLRDGTACDLHGDHKPTICKDFPTAPEQLLAGCGFSFEEA